MTNEIQVIEASPRSDMTLSREPGVVLEEAKRAAQALTDVISKKKNPVMYRDQQYLEFEDWQTVAKFYGITAKVVRTEYIEHGDVHGYDAWAVAFHVGNNQEISAAEGSCYTDEANWMKKPLAQIKSMAQTRACSKALRNVLSWVVVLAGYKATPAEEIGEKREPDAATPPDEIAMAWNETQVLTDINEKLAAMNSGDTDAMEAHLKKMTFWKDKNTKEDKWLTLTDLARVAKHKPNWIKGIHKKVVEEYQAQFGAK